MSTVTQVELDAKLEAIEARADARLARFEERIDAAIKVMHQDRTDIKAEFVNLKVDNKETRTTIIVTGLTSVLAIVLGIAAFNATVLSNMVASFDSGRDTATAITQSTELMRQTQLKLDELSKALNAASTQKQSATTNQDVNPKGKGG